LTRTAQLVFLLWIGWTSQVEVPTQDSDVLQFHCYIEEALNNGFIHPSTSPGTTGFFFVEKNDGGLRPCSDYRALNNVNSQVLLPIPSGSSSP